MLYTSTAPIVIGQLFLNKARKNTNYIKIIIWFHLVCIILKAFLVAKNDTYHPGHSYTKYREE